MLSEFDPLLEKNSLPDVQKVLLSNTFLMFRLLKYFSQFSAELFLLNLFFSLELVIITFVKDLVINTLLPYEAFSF